MQASFSSLGIYEFRPGNALSSQIQEALCIEGNASIEICQNLMFAMFELNSNLIDKVSKSSC